ncbi:MAG: glycosyltransferase [Chloroflexota bacterium]
MYSSVPVGHKSLESYRPLVGDEVVERVRALAAPLAGARVLHLNVTAFDTVTAEKLAGLVPLMNDVGLNAEWQVVRTTDQFGAANRAMYNALGGTFVEWSAEVHDVWLKYNSMNAELFDEAYDFVVVHDPQPAGILSGILHMTGKRPPGKWVWRSHLDLSEAQPEVWDALYRHVQLYDAAVFSAEEYVRPELGAQHTAIIPPTIDPLNPRNVEISNETVHNILARYSINPDRPLICQVSRFDRWSDPTGAIDVYRLVKQQIPQVQLVLVANVLSSESEAWPYYERTARYAGEDYDIHLLSSLNSVGPMEVNAFQRAAQVTLQKSVRKGFSPAIAQAGWKRRPVVAGRVGGLHLQVLEDRTGFLCNTTEEFGRKMLTLLNDEELAAEMGAAGHEHVKDNFLVTSCLSNYLSLFNSLLGH